MNTALTGTPTLHELQQWMAALIVSDTLPDTTLPLSTPSHKFGNVLVRARAQPAKPGGARTCNRTGGSNALFDYDDEHAHEHDT